MKSIVFLTAAFISFPIVADAAGAQQAKGVVLITPNISMPQAAAAVPGLSSPAMSRALSRFNAVMPSLLARGPVVAAANGGHLLLLSGSTGRAAVIGLSSNEASRPRIRVLGEERLDKVREDLARGDVWQARLSMDGLFDGYRPRRPESKKPLKIVTPRDASVASFLSGVARSDIPSRDDYIRRALAHVETRNGRKLAMRELEIGRRMRENRVPVSRQAALTLLRECLDGTLHKQLMKARPGQRFVVDLKIAAHGQAELHSFAMSRRSFSIESMDSPAGFIPAETVRRHVVAGTVDDLIALMKLPGVRSLNSRKP